MTKTQAEKRAQAAFERKTYDIISVRVRKEKHLKEMLDYAWKGRCESKNKYIEDALLEKLTRDGITIESIGNLEGVSEQQQRGPRHYIGYEVLYYYNDPEETDEWYQHYMETQYLTTILEEAREKARKFYSKQPEFKKQFTKYYIRGWNIEAHNRAEAEQILKKMFEDSNDPDLEFELPDAVYNEEVEL